MVCGNMKLISSVHQDISRVSKANEWYILFNTRNNFIFPNMPCIINCIVLFIMHFMIMNTCEIIMNNHTCEIIDFISCRKINKPVLYFKLAIIKQNNSVLAWLRHENWQSFGSFRYKVHCTVATLKML